MVGQAPDQLIIFRQQGEGHADDSYIPYVILSINMKTITVVLLILALAGCLSSPEAERETTDARLPREPMFYGDGGRGMSISILSPAADGLAESDAYLPALIQGVLVSDFTRFSAMDVLDRSRLDQILWENESGYYHDEAEIARIGHTTPSQYLMIGTLKGMGARFFLQISVADSQTAQTIWVHSSSVTRSELENFSAIKAASENLLDQMGVELTSAGLQALHSENRQLQYAETALARGVTAQRGGSTAAALSFLSEAVSFNAGLHEADARLLNLRRNIQSGNLGQNVRNELELAREWTRLMDEAIAFYRQYPVFDIVYNVNARQGALDFINETVNISFDVWLMPNARFDAMMNISRGLEATGKMDEWGLGEKFTELISTGRNGVFLTYRMGIIAELVNERGNYLGSGIAGDLRHPTIETVLGSHWLNIDYGMGSRNPSDVRNILRTPINIENTTLNFLEVDANLLSDNLFVNFLEAGRVWNNQIELNAIENIRIIPTELSLQNYFRGQRNFRGTAFSF